MSIHHTLSLMIFGAISANALAADYLDIQTNAYVQKAQDGIKDAPECSHFKKEMEANKRFGNSAQGSFIMAMQKTNEAAKQAGCRKSDPVAGIAPPPGQPYEQNKGAAIYMDNQTKSYVRNMQALIRPTPECAKFKIELANNTKFGNSGQGTFINAMQKTMQSATAAGCR